MKSFDIHGSREIIRAFGELMYEAPQLHGELYTEIGYRDRQVADIIHNIEFLDMDKNCGFEYALELKKNRQARRNAKELMEFVKILVNFNDKHPELISEIKCLVNKFDSVIEEQSTRVYTPKENHNSKSAQKHFYSEIDRQLDNSVIKE